MERVNLSLERSRSDGLFLLDSVFSRSHEQHLGRAFIFLAWFPLWCRAVSVSRFVYFIGFYNSVN